ncbi:MAG: hypothetical protein Q8R10_05280 [Pseudomonas sp.]|uniref:hypothetical protein n=1 Tax=Pseudomonas sp. TaxID=306 RepID=UPI002737025D|nr:hypothetical protein [Pseudomonas sp.]MDP3845821.1 hypothetical protein [Pseudomonas sp.]
MTIFGLTLEQWANFKFYIGLAKPLLLFVYLPIVLAGLLFLVTRRLPWHKKAPALLAYLIIAYAVPLGDVTVNSINMAKMCGKVGLHVNRAVEVDGYFARGTPAVDLRKYKYSFVEFSQPGIPVTHLERINGEIVKSRISEPAAEWENIVLAFDQRDIANGVSVSQHEVIRSRKSGEILAEEISYAAWSGWLDRKIAALIDNSIGSCYSRPFMYESIDKILIPKDLDK